MSFKLLNLDEISDNVDRSIVLKGKTHQMREISVEEMIEAQKRISSMESDKSTDPVDQLNAVIDMLTNRFPTADRAEFSGMSLGKLMTLYRWLHTAPDAVVEGEEKPGA